MVYYQIETAHRREIPVDQGEFKIPVVFEDHQSILCIGCQSDLETYVSEDPGEDRPHRP